MVDYSIMEYSSSATFPTAYAALGLLMERPMHGYELGRSLESGFGELWRIASSQLYAVLHRLEDAEWVESAQEEGDASPPRTVYHVTRPGREAFEAWVAAPVAHLRDMRTEFLVKTYFLRRRGAQPVDDLMARQAALLDETARGLEARGGVISDDPVFGEIVASYRVGRMRSMIRWLEETRERLREREEME